MSENLALRNRPASSVARGVLVTSALLFVSTKDSMSIASVPTQAVAVSHTPLLLDLLTVATVLQLAFVGLAVIGAIVLYKVFQGSSVEGAIRDTKGSIKGTYNEAKGSVKVDFLSFPQAI